MEKTHFHYIIWGADKIQADTGNFIEQTIIEVVADSQEVAIQKARFMVPGKNVYFVRQCIEHFENQCSSQHH